MSAAIGRHAHPVEASDLIVTSDAFGDARPDLAASRQRTLPRIGALMQSGKIPVVTGFIGATGDGIITTFGRGGSDYSATILAYCLDADAV